MNSLRSAAGLDAEVRRRNLPIVRERLEREALRIRSIRRCRTHGCENESKTHHGPYADMCDDCIAALGYHTALG